MSIDKPLSKIQLISTFIFTTYMAQLIHFLNVKFHAYSFLLLPYSTVCVGPGRLPWRQVFSKHDCFQRNLDEFILRRQHLSQVMRKPTFSICKNKGADQLEVTAKLISAFVFASRIVLFLYSLNPKLPASSHLLCFYIGLRKTCSETT